MTCGKLYVQSYGLVWFLSTVFLICTPQTKIAGLKHATQAVYMYNLVIQRPRITGGALRIPLDSTVKFVKNLSSDIERNIIRLTHGPNSKTLVLRASSPQELQQWLAAITAALSTYATNQSAVKAPAKMRMTTIPKIPTTSVPPFAVSKQHTSTLPQNPTVICSAPIACSLRRVVRQNIPAAMQLFISVGQIIASAG
ncbi:hypothetical protein F441_11197 [Phytophthora nicotianae CJ01A1]|uniref:PH domain-containing protein n=5 Tax=Phytophthora nicotianae TaxID=4792 RepID=W2Q3R1_PHYN3|nr:hypothetical protein PPTG_13392 [Phytophthora nicotianae INRA-310]ETI43930.1 hypothetical protein F443_11276 [Phytophthora nicotianae P1569]ETK83989.1 hypothetical protein L915_10986 [Phytophthora nicotianae]ETP13746.1 hypothetical protein F441_11197 [Phytophthora nicotianae CJ01A1]ETP41817.1 hypothetical protein F442_11183 [Phytophthora nicotianae P10297]ETL37404.1 hypothetical protein L916_10885 [Phytophthora nicotianae]